MNDMTFLDLGLPAGLVSVINKAGFTTPKPIQEQAIPVQLEGRDVLGIAQTGSGKTAAFGLPLITGLIAEGGRSLPKAPRGLVLAPTRELAVQIEETLRTFLRGSGLTTVLVFGGVPRRPQVNKLARGADIVVATPGRLKELLDTKCLTLAETRWLVLDEADRMLDMGFIRDVRRIVKATASNRRTALFSATMDPDVAELANGLLRDPVRIDVAPQGTTIEAIRQELLPTPGGSKRGRLANVLKGDDVTRAIVFTRTKRSADRVAKNLTTDGFAVAAIHGNKSQNARQSALRGFRDGKISVLVATDIAARGNDIPMISHVINYELPDEPDSYVHRIGRTGRNGATGAALTLFDPGERAKLKAIEKLIRKAIPLAEGEIELPQEDTKKSPDEGGRTKSRNRNRKPRRPSARSGRGRPARGQKRAEKGRAGAGSAPASMTPSV